MWSATKKVTKIMNSMKKGVCPSVTTWKRLAKWAMTMKSIEDMINPEMGYAPVEER